jgi:hypothetical protein
MVGKAREPPEGYVKCKDSETCEAFEDYADEVAELEPNLEDQEDEGESANFRLLSLKSQK